MTLFDNSKKGEFLLFVWYFKMNLEVSGMLAASAKIQYIHTLLCDEVFHQLEMLSVQVVSKTI